MSYTIYVLSLSDIFTDINQDIFYIGITGSPLNVRLYYHTCKGNSSSTGDVLRNLKRNNINFYIHPIFLNLSKKESIEKERKLIKKYSVPLKLINIAENPIYIGYTEDYIAIENRYSHQLKCIYDRIL